nr:MAG TPA: SpvD [Caudoviricetes sp.]
MRYFIKSRLKMMAKYVILCMGNCFLLCVCVVFLFHRTENRGECRIGILPEGRWA